jgi:hypothetical protein
MITATALDAETAEVRSEGSPGVLICYLDGATGEWTPREMILHDGDVLEAADRFLPLNDETIAAIEQVFGAP